MRVAFANMKGGVAKTTSAMWLAEALALLDAPVTVHDLDPQAGATKWRRVAKASGHPLPFEVVASNGESLLDLEAGGEHWDLLDAAPSGPGLEAALRNADFVVIPTSDGPGDIQQTWATLALLEERRVPAATLLCRVEPRTRSYHDAVTMLDEQAAPRFETIITKCQELKAGAGIDMSLEHDNHPKLYGYGQVLQELKEALQQ